MPEFFAEFLDEDDDSPDAGVIVPGIYASLLPWAEDEFERNGVDPRCRFRVSVDGEPLPLPPPDPDSTAGRTLAAVHAGEPVTVSVWIARGQRWIGTGWSDEVFELPWSAVSTVRVHVDDLVIPVTHRR